MTLSKPTEDDAAEASLDDEEFSEEEVEFFPEPAAKELLVLVSTQFGTGQQRSNQERAIVALRANNIPFEEIDGSDPSNQDRRNELFEISGLRGTYPQFFFTEEEETSFLCEYDVFQQFIDSGALSQLFPPIAATE